MSRVLLIMRALNMSYWAFAADGEMRMNERMRPTASRDLMRMRTWRWYVIVVITKQSKMSCA